jgi:SprT protein
MPGRDSGTEDAALTEQCREHCIALGHPTLASAVRVFWNRRMRTAAGRAFWPAKIIELNPILLGFAPAETDRTLRHELAHLIAYDRAGRRRIAPHGAEWLQACADLGIPGERACHNLPIQRRKIARKHAYVCTQCFAVIHRVRPLKRNVACAACCKQYNQGRYDSRFRLIAIASPKS